MKKIECRNQWKVQQSWKQMVPETSVHYNCSIPPPMKSTVQNYHYAPIIVNKNLKIVKVQVKD